MDPTIVQKFIRGELTGNDLVKIKELLKTDENFKAEVFFSKQLYWIGRNEELVNDYLLYKSAIKSINIVPENETGQDGIDSLNKSKLWFWISIGGSILGIIIISVLLLSRFGIISNEPPLQLAFEYLEPYENVLTIPNDPSNVLFLAMQAYDNGNYPLAESRLEEIIVNSNDQNIKLYLSVTYLFNQKPNRAIQLLEALKENPNDGFQNDAIWYLALAQLEANNVKAAKAELESLRDDIQYGAKSKALLEKLD